jgi:hypothetical protein
MFAELTFCERKEKSEINRLVDIQPLDRTHILLKTQPIHSKLRRKCRPMEKITPDRSNICPKSIMDFTTHPSAKSIGAFVVFVDSPGVNWSASLNLVLCSIGQENV